LETFFSPHFCISIEGSGIHIPSSDGAAPVVGFYSVSRLRAASASQASDLATTRCLGNLRHALQGRGGSVAGLVISVESVVRCSWLEASIWPGGGCIFFSADGA